MATQNIGADLDLAQLDYQRKQALADALRKQSMPPTQGQMVGRRYIAPSWTQGLASIFEGQQADQMGRQATEELRNARQAYDQRNQGELQNFMQAMRGTPASESQNVAPDEYGQMVNQPIQNPAQAPDQGKALALALQSKNPMLQTIGGKLLENQLTPKLQVVGRSLLNQSGQVIGTDATWAQEQEAERQRKAQELAEKIAEAKRAEQVRVDENRRRDEANEALRRDLAAQSDATRRALSKIGQPSDIPKLKQGEVWNPAEQRVDAVKGSDTYIKQSNLHGKDYAALQGVDTKLDNAIGTINKILDPKNKGAFESNFGGYNALASQYLPGKTQDTKASIESLKSNMKAAGLEMMRSGGGIGSMTEREWPIVEGMISRITPMMSENEARDELNKVAAYMQKIKNNAREAYNTEWGSTQFVKNKPSIDAIPENNKQTLPSLPSAAEHSGRRMRTPDGSIIRSNGKEWVKE